MNAAAPSLGTALGAAADDSARSWDFQADAEGQPPAGFTFAKTGAGRPGRWIVRIDPDAPAGDHVLAQVGSADGFALVVADAPLLKDPRLEVRCKPVSRSP